MSTEHTPPHPHSTTSPTIETPSTDNKKVSLSSNYTGGAMCIRVQVRAKSQYRVCTLDPQDESTDTWAYVTGEFEQCFFIKSNCNGRPVISDRLVKIKLNRTSTE